VEFFRRRRAEPDPTAGELTDQERAPSDSPVSAVPAEPVRPLFASAIEEEEAADAAAARQLEAGLTKARAGFVGRLRGYLAADDGGPSWDDVEETLIAADVGASVAAGVVDRARRRPEPGGAEAAVRAELAALLVPRDRTWTPRPSIEGAPAVILVVGVNGTGKTTTIGKLAPTRSARPPSSSSGSGPTGRASRSSPTRRVRTRARWSSMRSTRRLPVGPTS
jgi:fused signal recognition particle receptor